MNQLLNSIKKKIFTGQNYVILFSGDSTTSTEWVFPSWRAVLEYVLKMHLEKAGKSTSDSLNAWAYSWWNMKFINSSMNGATTQDIIDRMDNDILKFKPDLFIGIFGDNDVDKISEQLHGEQIRTILTRLTASISDVVYSPGITIANDYHNQRNKEYIAEENVESLETSNLHYVNMYEEFAKYDHKRFFTGLYAWPDEEYLSDGKGGKFDAFHPNSLGNAYIAKILLKELFDIEFDPEGFIEDVRNGVKYPRC